MEYDYNRLIGLLNRSRVGNGVREGEAESALSLARKMIEANKIRKSDLVAAILSKRSLGRLSTSPDIVDDSLVTHAYEGVSRELRDEGKTYRASSAATPNFNGKVYPEAEWEKAADDFVNRYVRSGQQQGQQGPHRKEPPGPFGDFDSRSDAEREFWEKIVDGMNAGKASAFQSDFKRDKPKPVFVSWKGIPRDVTTLSDEDVLSYLDMIGTMKEHLLLLKYRELVNSVSAKEWDKIAELSKECDKIERNPPKHPDYVKLVTERLRRRI